MLNTRPLLIMSKQTAISNDTTRTFFPNGINKIIRAADLAENSEVRVAMVIKPWGYALWEQIQAVLDRMFKVTGHRIRLFPSLSR